MTPASTERPLTRSCTVHGNLRQLQDRYQLQFVCITTVAMLWNQQSNRSFGSAMCSDLLKLQILSKLIIYNFTFNVAWTLSMLEHLWITLQAR